MKPEELRIGNRVEQGYITSIYYEQGVMVARVGNQNGLGS